MKAISQTYSIKAPLEKVWQALVDPMQIDRWGGGPATMSDKVGTKFKLWGGDIHGTNTQVIKYKKLVQDWYAGKWSQPSKLQFTLSHNNGYTNIYLVHQNVPDEEVKGIEQGWKDYYMEPLKNLIEKEVKK